MAYIDPRTTVIQMVSLQCFFYVCMTTLLVFFRVLLGTRASLERLFEARYCTVSTGDGLAVIVTYLLSGVVGAGMLVPIVEKAKRCLDFVCSVFIIHLLICSIYAGWPWNVSWWGANFLSMLIMVVGGEYLCAVNELREIPLFSLSNNNNNNNSNKASSPSSTPRRGHFSPSQIRLLPGGGEGEGRRSRQRTPPHSRLNSPPSRSATVDV